MALQLISDELWNEIEPLIPKEPLKPMGGRRWVDERACFTGIVFVLNGGLPWQMLPAEMGCSRGLGEYRYIVERTLAWFSQNHRLRLCYEKSAAHFQALHQLTAEPICARKLG